MLPGRHAGPVAPSGARTGFPPHAAYSASMGMPNAWARVSNRARVWSARSNRWRRRFSAYVSRARVMPAFQAHMMATVRATLARMAGGMVSDMRPLLSQPACVGS